jgi:predicted AAA+ superfamily ATPase
MLSKLFIEQVIGSQGERLERMETGLPRQVMSFGNLSSHALIVSGIRRSGKSTWLQQIRKNTTEPSIFLNFEDPRLAGFDLGDFNRMQEIAEQQSVMTFFFDEIQTVPGWESFVRFRLDEGYRIYITGSNASMLSRELGTKLTGRQITREMFPFSYSEFLAFKGLQPDKTSSDIYLKNGGFPEYVKTGSPEVLMNAFGDIIVRDIAIRHNIKNTTLLKQLGGWLVSATGKPFTANSLRKIFNISSSSTIMEYLSYFVDAYLFWFVPKFSYALKVQMVNPKKVYCIDNGFVEINSVSFSDDTGRIFENMVFLHLRRQTPEIYYFSGKKECDFVVFQNGRFQSLFQVCLQIDQNNMEREFDGLIEAMEFFNVASASIITQDQSDSFQKDGKTITLIPFYIWATAG